MDGLGKLLMLMAAILFVAGGVIWLIGRFGGGFLPGDVVVRRENATFVFPIVTCIVVSLVLTVVLNVVFRR